MAPTPRPERTIYCPAAGCGQAKTTKARRNTVVVCVGCGGTFRVPAPEPVTPPTTTAEPAVEPGASPTAEPVDVTVRQTARPRARGAATAPAAPSSPAPEIPREPVDPATLTPPGQERAKEAGRRGGRSVGLGRYKERTRR